MTQPLINPQVALQAAATLHAASNPGNTWKDTADLLTVANRLLRWLDANTPPPPDQEAGTG